MADPAPQRPAAQSLATEQSRPWNMIVVLMALIALLILSWMALDNLVTDSTAQDGGKRGASDAIALISASGAILTGIVGAYFGVNIASKSANAAQATQAQASDATRAAVTQATEAQKTAVAAAAALDPNSEAAKSLARNLQ